MRIIILSCLLLISLMVQVQASSEGKIGVSVFVAENPPDTYYDISYSDSRLSPVVEEKSFFEKAYTIIRDYSNIWKNAFIGNWIRLLTLGNEAKYSFVVLSLAFVL